MKFLELKIPPLIIVFIFLIFIFIFPQIEIFEEMSYQKVKSTLAFLLLVLSVFFSIMGVYEFKKHKTTVDPRFPEKSSTIVNTGIYAYTRNPMYLGFLCFLMAFAIYFRGITSLALIPLFIIYMNRFQIQPEEKLLEKSFGESYEKYKKKARRWL